jgi:hypothetical protein
MLRVGFLAWPWVPEVHTVPHPWPAMATRTNCESLPGLRSTWPGIPAPRPPQHADCGDTEHAALQPAPRRRCLAVPVEQLTIDIRRLTRWHVPRPRPALGRWNPAADVDERLGTTHRTCLLLVKLLAIETEARNMELHRVHPPFWNDPSSASSHTPGSSTTDAGSASAGMRNVVSPPDTCT